MLLLFQVLTGDAWSGLMAETMLDEASGKCEGPTCGSLVAVPYFISFQIIGSFVFLNLVVAVILENFSSLGSVNPFLVSSADVDSFKEVWAEFDPDADNFIPVKDLPSLLLAVSPPMGLRGVGDTTDAQKLCLQLRLDQTAGKVAFQDVLKQLTLRSFERRASIRPDELERVTATAQPTLSVPTLDTAKVDQRRLSKSDAFAANLPSVRRAFALQVIERYARDWSANVRTRHSEQGRAGKAARASGAAGGKPPSSSSSSLMRPTAGTASKAKPAPPTRKALNAAATECGGDVGPGSVAGASIAGATRVAVDGSVDGTTVIGDGLIAVGALEAQPTIRSMRNVEEHGALADRLAARAHFDLQQTEAAATASSAANCGKTPGGGGRPKKRRAETERTPPPLRYRQPAGSTSRGKERVMV